ncbi:Wadjet anti-phage system protein JetD domain-containing protein [Burkholderia ambifaria]|uniref:Wadjet anti-phage system protein JetD domain-containing protein n=1 Tax=Burkholderia ambifaria TaxID=152480 RepID=UPI00158D2844|nr:Wadjet anti-phage system protein JetD domain-containing protein [Burkholderia ambifaria]
MWQTPKQRCALLELLVQGTLTRRVVQADAYDTLAELPWTRSTGRRNQVALVDAYRTELVMLMERVWPDWKMILAELTAAGLPPTPDGWSKLEDARRAIRLPALPERLNHRTAIALTAPHSKANLTPRRQAALADTETTHDGLLRLRPPRGLCARTAQGTLDLCDLARMLGEAPIPERAFLDGFAFEGPLRAVLLVENRGAWRDLPELDGWLVAHVPGWDTTTVVHLLARVDPETPIVHFGDLDPNGVRIFLRLRDHRPNLKWFIPDFWTECVEPRPLKRSWPAKLDLSEAPKLVKNLARKRLWLEQEPLVVDSRIPVALANCANDR